jgi:hypothetical protein
MPAIVSVRIRLNYQVTGCDTVAIMAWLAPVLPTTLHMVRIGNNIH